MDIKTWIGISPKRKPGRPKKVQEAPMEVKSDTDTAKVEVGQNLRLNRSPFDIGRFGVTEDPDKDRRWVKPTRIEERKYNDGYERVLVKGNEIRSKGNMILMERPKALADESRLRKELRTAEQNSATREDFKRRVEQLSSKWGMDLHKLVND